ncbi:tyrosine-type recombinase/integrase [Actinoplanes sp. RD1]|uniref:tyrosine-type recombinase/integrase n=1 Tax=Actinoplanes sp. RD1 TaxID=3064538 RepID=UPI0027419249|nr:site-specific integrase [Actinoplanes sp. RD1]
MTINGASPTRPEIEAARLLLDRLGISPEQLLDAGSEVPVPTFGEYIPHVVKAVGSGTVRVYQTYWRRVETQWGDRKLDEPTATEIEEFAGNARINAVVRGNARGGHLAAEHTIAALRCLYRHAIADGILPERGNTALRVDKPRRLESSRRALLDSQLAEINRIAGTTGNDRDLDSLLVRLHVETACRRGGALALRKIDLDRDHSLIRLREKGGTERWQPVSPTLMRHLLLHHARRGQGVEQGQLLRYANGNPITRRRYDHLWRRSGEHLPWVATHQVSTHWLRHTTLTWVERHFGYAVARAFAGHNGRTDFGVTATYVRASLYEVAATVSALTGEPHPLAI